MSSILARQYISGFATRVYDAQAVYTRQMRVGASSSSPNRRAVDAPSGFARRKCLSINDLRVDAPTK